MTDSVQAKAVLLLGHGSKAPEANETLRKVAASVQFYGGYGAVLPAFLQMERPDFQEGVDRLVSMGFRDLIVMPYFLYMGLHVTKDLPEEMERALARYPGIKLTLTRNLGFHDKLVDITVERIGEALGTGVAAVAVAVSPAAFSQHPIEKESFRIIGAELDEGGLSTAELPVIKRVIHSTADFEFRDILRFTPNAVRAGAKAIRGGCNIITDVRMVEAGITPGRLVPFGAKVWCFLSDADVVRDSELKGTTRTAASMRKAAARMAGGIVAIGNAPTALTEILRLIKEGAPPPALIVGVPVGFVGAVEAKEELKANGIEHITTEGRKGGSTVAVAIVNALAIEAGNSKET
ncbi:MAG: precorrin-8X methylmutase [Deltaproteobacteria bacterium]|nr:precorrin-8X methylmutase [Deltaproteobacteria bacterium]